MSLESAKAFIDRIKTDEEFAKKVAACKDAETRMALATAEGFEFTAEQIKDASSELSEEDLRGVDGGGWFAKYMWKNFKCMMTSTTGK
ncbi:Nif11-like leader peptide family natural product precursor [Elusimicrobiota bacterium]